MTTKFCPKCKTEKDVSEFGPAKRRDGLQSYCRECTRARARDTVRLLREKVFDKLGHACIQCGFNDKRALQIDHINGGGNKEHRDISSPATFLRKVLKDNEGLYQILCANCNWIKRCENREHPYDNKMSEEGKQSASQKSRSRVATAEERRKLSESHMGQIPWNKGPLSSEQKAFLSQVAKDRESARTPEQRSASAFKREASKREASLAI